MKLWQFVTVAIVGFILFYMLTNGTHAATTPQFTGQTSFNDYYAEYEREVNWPTPTAGHGVDCDSSSSQQNSQAADEYFVTANGSTHWGAIHDSNFSWRKIFVCPGDYSRTSKYSGNDGNEVYWQQGGSDAGGNHLPDSSWLYVTWWDDDSAFTHAYTQSSAQRAILPRTEGQGSFGAVAFRGITWVGRPSETDAVRFDLAAAAEDLIFDRVYINPTLKSAGETGDGFILDGQNEYVTLQNSVITGCGFEPDQDDVGIGIGATDYVRIVNNEVWDCTDNLTGACTSCTTNGVLVENNDFYLTSASYASLDGAPGSDESPNFPDSNGDYACRENAIDMKGAYNPSSAEADRQEFKRNRFWGYKPGFAGGTSCTCGSSGDYHNHVIQFFNEGFQNISLVDNIFVDNEASAISFHAGGERQVSAKDVSIVGNIFFNQPNNDNRSSGSGGTCGTTQTPSHVQPIRTASVAASVEYYLNTFAYITGGSGSGDHAFFDSTTDTSNKDFRCNLIINSEPHDGVDPGTGHYNWNTFVDTTLYSVTNESKVNYQKAGRDWASSITINNGEWYYPTSKTCLLGTEDGCFAFVAENGGTADTSQPNWCNTLGCTVVDNSVTYRAALGPYGFYRKLWSGTEAKWLRAIVPWSGKTDWAVCDGKTIGTLSGYGVSNDTFVYP